MHRKPDVQKFSFIYIVVSKMFLTTEYFFNLQNSFELQSLYYMYVEESEKV